jgi:hypothetical protein
MATLILSTIRLVVFDRDQKEPDMHDEIPSKFGEDLCARSKVAFLGMGSRFRHDCNSAPSLQHCKDQITINNKKGSGAVRY